MIQRQTNISKKTNFIARFALLLAIEAIFSFTALGSIPLGPLVATLAMLPVVLSALLMGKRAGSLMGFFAGLFSFLKWTFAPPSPLAFVFTPFYKLGEISGNGFSLLICFLPRILTGLVTALCFKAFSRLPLAEKPRNFLRYGLSACLGSLCNTFGVLGGIGLFFGQAYAQSLGFAYEALLAILALSLLSNGIPEALLASLSGLFIARPIRKQLRGKNA